MDENQHNLNICPPWDEYFCKICEVTKTRSPCKRLQVGCILTVDNRIVSMGYNGNLPGCEHESIIIDGHEQTIVHAEQNAITDCAKRGVSCKNATVYITHFPCIICTRLLISCKVKKIVYIEDYKNNELCTRFLKDANIDIVKFNNHQ